MTHNKLADDLGISKSQLSQWKARGCPVDDVGRAKNWITQNIKRKKNALAEPTTDIPSAEAPISDESYSWEARLARARKIEVDVYNAAQATIGSKAYPQLQSLLASYQKALQGIAEAERTALETRIQTGELIHRDTCRAILAELLVPIKNALDLLPVTERTRCNPNAPEIAEATLRAWKDTLLLRLSQADTKF